MTDLNSTEKKKILQEIWKCLAEKENSAPVFLSAREFDEWRKCHGNYFLHRGYLSIWDGIAVPPGSEEVVIEKRRVREGTKPYLIFGSVESFHNYCRNAHLLGAMASALFGEGLLSRIELMAKDHNAPASACDELQEALERSVGLNFMADASAVSDGQLYGSLYNYYKKAISQKAATVFAKYGLIVDVDISEWDGVLSSGDDLESICVSRTDFRGEEIDASRLFGKIIELMDRLSGQKDSRYDIKDNLLGKVVRSALATKEFISDYYANLRDRKSVWRPAAFSYQVYFAHENGTEYLKNPHFVRTCGNMSIGDMVESQIHASKSVNIDQKAISGMYSILNRVRYENLQDTVLIECAENVEQIGKALSKELRTEEAKNALARALLVSVLKENRTADFSDGREEDYHE